MALGAGSHLVIGISAHSSNLRRRQHAAELIGEEALNEIRSAVAAAAQSRIRGGTPGEPFPKDLRMEKHCEQMLASLSCGEPTFDLYAGLLKDARYAITRQRKSKEALEDEDE